MLSVPFRDTSRAPGTQKEQAKTVTTRRLSISRRTLLRGAGVSLGLPWLEAMAPTSALASSKLPKNPVRLGVLYMPNGVNTRTGRRKGPAATSSCLRRSSRWPI